MTKLDNAEDFVWYKKKMDVDSRYVHRHCGEPEKYPCMVISEYYDDPNGPYTYYHSFVYQQLVTCPHCKHETLVWPNQAD